MDDPLMQPKQTTPPGGLFAAPPASGLGPPASGLGPPCAGPAQAGPSMGSAGGPRPGTDAWKFLAALLALGGRAAIWQVAAELHRPDHTISQRPSEMEAKGWIRRTGEFNLRPLSEKKCEIFEALIDLRGRPLTTTPTTASPQ